MNINVQVFLWAYIWFLLGRFLEVKYLGYGNLCFLSRDIAEVFSKVASKVQGFQFSLIILTTYF
jgi:hypothetical protein